MATATLVRSSYPALLQEVRKVLAQGRARAKRALEQEEVRTWWEAARIVNEHLRFHDGRAAYGEKVIAHLANDLSVTEVYLYDILRFQRAFPILNSSLELTLSHYRILAKIDNPKERKLLYWKAVRDGLTVPALLGQIRARKLIALPDLRLAASAEDTDRGAGKWGMTQKSRPLIPRRGKFYTYRMVKPRDLHERFPFYAVDLGFGNRLDLKLVGIKNPKEGEVIEAIRTRESPEGDRYRFKRSSFGKETLYTYKATVKEVVDDDTLWADVDQGFRFWSLKKFRFRGIDAAEIGKGKQASDFVKQTLTQVPFIVLTATGRDKFGRPLADVFYLKGTEDQEKVLREGIYLNQELLDRSLAQRV